MVSYGDLISVDYPNLHVYFHSGVSNILLGSNVYFGAENPYVVCNSTGGNILVTNYDNDKLYIFSGTTTNAIGSFDLISTKDSFGIQLNKDDNLIAHINDGYVYTFSGVSNTIIGSVKINAPNWWGLGLDSEDNMAIGYINTDHIHFYSGISNTLTGSIVANTSADPDTRGNAYDAADNLISADNASDHIYVHDKSTAAITGSFASPGAAPRGLTIYNVGGPSTDFSTTDEITLTDSITTSYSHTPQTLSISLSDELTLTDSVSINKEKVEYSFDTENSITLTDSVSVLKTHPTTVFDVSFSDETTLADTLTTNYIAGGELSPTATYNINTKLNIGGTDYFNYLNMKVSKSMSDYNTSSSFSITLDSPYGRYKTSFTIGEEVIIYADDKIVPTKKLFVGALEKIRFSGFGTSQTVTLSGRDYSVRLMDTTVEPSVYTDAEVSTIVDNIMINFVDDVTRNNIDVTTTTLERINFRHTTVYDAINELAELSSFSWYIDTDKDLHFEEKDTVNSGYLLNNKSIIATNYEQTREGMANDVWVYGDKYLSAFQENLKFDGGSVLTLKNKPHNTYVEYLGSPLNGGVYQLSTELVSGVEYLVSYYDSNLIFISGTDIGYSSIPASGGSVVCRYDREIPIVRHQRDTDSITTYGKKTKVIQDSSIKDPKTADSFVANEITKSDPLNGLEVEIRGWLDITPGNTIHITLDDFNVDTTVGIVSIDYLFDANRTLANRVIKIRVDKKILDITDQIKNLSKKIQKLESQNLVEEQTITRYEEYTGSVNVVGSAWEVKQRTIGSSFILGHLVNGILGSPAVSICGSQVALGDSRSALSTIASGGEV